MPALNFKKEFVPAVLRGIYGSDRHTCYQGLKLINKNTKWAAPLSEREYLIEINKFIDTHFVGESMPKKQTIRATRKRPFKQDDTLYLYTGMRTKNCVKLGSVSAKKVRNVFMIHEMFGLQIKVGFDDLIVEDFESPTLLRIANAAGFDTIDEMRNFFVKDKYDEFEGQLITW